MPYPESCPECGGAFRNTGTHYTARRNEVGRHVLLELGCQNTSRRYWWNFTTGTTAEDGVSATRRVSLSTNGNGQASANGNGHTPVITLERPQTAVVASHDDAAEVPPAPLAPPAVATPAAEVDVVSNLSFEMPRGGALESPATEPATASDSLRDAFVRQLQLDRLTLRQMRSWLMADDARRAIEVAAGATEATYERLALILFGVDLPRLLGKQPAPPPTPGMSAEERLELQREKARIRARLRRAAAKAARQST